MLTDLGAIALERKKPRILRVTTDGAPPDNGLQLRFLKLWDSPSSKGMLTSFYDCRLDATGCAAVRIELPDEFVLQVEAVRGGLSRSAAPVAFFVLHHWPRGEEILMEIPWLRDVALSVHGIPVEFDLTPSIVAYRPGEPVGTKGVQVFVRRSHA